MCHFAYLWLSQALVGTAAHLFLLPSDEPAQFAQDPVVSNLRRWRPQNSTDVELWIQSSGMEARTDVGAAEFLTQSSAEDWLKLKGRVRPGATAQAVLFMKGDSHSAQRAFVIPFGAAMLLCMAWAACAVLPGMPAGASHGTFEDRRVDSLVRNPSLRDGDENCDQSTGCQPSSISEARWFLDGRFVVPRNMQTTLFVRQVEGGFNVEDGDGNIAFEVVTKHSKSMGFRVICGQPGSRTKSFGGPLVEVNEESAQVLNVWNPQTGQVWARCNSHAQGATMSLVQPSTFGLDVLRSPSGRYGVWTTGEADDEIACELRQEHGHRGVPLQFFFRAEAPVITAVLLVMWLKDGRFSAAGVS
mmetsp:Transcript_22639/g.57830  ORF Transcript_22639/g.57830 Transcript_22639/m.57830 type:complete len:358 (+) Transcript_22639:72-1145(+)